MPCDWCRQERLCGPIGEEQDMVCAECTYWWCLQANIANGIAKQVEDAFDF